MLGLFQVKATNAAGFGDVGLRFSAQGHECNDMSIMRAAYPRRVIHIADCSQSTDLSWFRTYGWSRNKLPNMTGTSRQIVLTRAKARALGIPLSDLLGPDFTRLFHDTYVGSGQMITLRLRARTIMRRLPAATHVSHHTAVRL